MTAVAPTKPLSPAPARLTDDLLGRVAAALVVVVAALSAGRAFGPLTYPGDIWRQADTAAIARNFARNGMDPFFPQINWGGTGPGYVETELQVMPWLTAALYQVFGEHEFLGRLVSLTFMLVASAAFWGLAKRVLPAPAARWALIAFALSPVFMRWGTAFMPEATVMAFVVLALYLFCRWVQEDRFPLLLGAGAAASVAGMVKPTSLHIGLVMLVWLGIAAPRRLRRVSLYLVGVAALVAPALWLWHASSLYREYGNTFGVISGGDSKFGNLALWTSPEFYVGLARTEILFVYGVFGLPLALLGAYALWQSRRTASAFAVVVAGFVGATVLYFVVGRYTGSDLGTQYHVYSLPYTALATGLGVTVLAQRFGGGLKPVARAAAAAVLVLLLGAQSVYVLARSFTDLSGTLGVCAERVAALSAPADLVIVGTDSTTIDDGVANNYEEPVIHHRADRRGWILAADQYFTAGLLEGYHDEGGRWFVNPDPALLTPAVTDWLAVNGRPAATASVDGCDIWVLPDGE
ncbi:glycosyltransferase family 39 protein [Pseudonocardia sp. WMMC193]|uniref:ArnT family glycosyltransferase n=1 Tax=Pseudonocardia sp. WMMC193 TaxID=2911965 RepID=UPI001F31ECA3|nr:glycosyltransferase family 39 protein [Pseudonocardia sp. WMMC193]MCF7552717.1 glycosyltransferase family 39 protein [Pseudonocardia sp. WMMC193]